MVGDIFLPYVCSSMATKGAPRVVNIPISWHTSLPVTRTSSQRFPGKKTIPSSSCWQSVRRKELGRHTYVLVRPPLLKDAFSLQCER